MRGLVVFTMAMVALGSYDAGADDFRAVLNVFVVWAIIGACWYAGTRQDASERRRDAP